MQKIRIVAVGKLKESFWREAVAEYVKRLSRFASVEIREIAERETLEEEAKDIVQQLFVDLFEKPVRLEGVRHLGAWLCMAVRNRCLNYLYVQDIEDKRKMLYLEAINEADAPEWLADEELIKRIRTTISGLPEKDRRICELRFYKCMKYAEIAEQLAVSENVAKVQVHRLIQKIKDNISPNDGAALELLVFFMNF